MGIQDTLNTMLPPIKSHVTSNSDGSRNGFYHPRDRNNDGDRTDDLDFHGALDINYKGGQNNGINKKFPKVYSPVAGQVINNPSASSYRAIIIRDRKGYTHRLLHFDKAYVKKHSWVQKGQKIGLMGGRGPKGRFQYARHIHYQIHDSEDKKVDPEKFWESGAKFEFLSAYIKDVFTDDIIPRGPCDYAETKLGRGTRRGTKGNDTIEMEGKGNHKVDAGPGNDLVKTGPGNDTLKGGRDKDVLKGGNGNDIYAYDPGDGHDDIVEASDVRLFRQSILPNNDTLKFGKCISFDDIESHFDDHNLVISFKNSPDDSITIHDWIINSEQIPGRRSWRTVQRRIENFKFSDGNTLTASEFLNSLGTNNNDNVEWAESGLHINTKAGNDTIVLGDYDNVVNAGIGNDSVKTGSGNDYLKGGAGTDTLAGGDGDDTYYYSRGDGENLVIEAGDKIYTPNPGSDTLRFGSNISIGKIESHFEENDLIIGFADISSDSIRLKNWRRANQRIENFEFEEDGLKISDREFLSTLGTKQDDNIDWQESGLILETKGGNDTLVLGDHYHEIDTGPGHDTLDVYGGKGVYRLGLGDDNIALTSDLKNGNWIDCGPGRDTVLGGRGPDTIIGGRDDDYLKGHGGDDIYVYNLYHGFDTIHDKYAGGNGGNDTLKFGPGITKRNTTARMKGSDLIIRIGGTGGVIIKNHAKANSKIENIIFSDGSRLSSIDINGVIQSMAAHIQDKGIVIPNPDDVNTNVNLISIVAPGLQAVA